MADLASLLVQLLAANQTLVLRFLLGTVGALCYFMAVKSGLVKIERSTAKLENPYLEKKAYLVFFCLIGGLLACLYETNFLGSFIQGLLIRPTIKGLLEGKEGDQ